MSATLSAQSRRRCQVQFPCNRPDCSDTGGSLVASTGLMLTEPPVTGNRELSDEGSSRYVRCSDIRSHRCGLASSFRPASSVHRFGDAAIILRPVSVGETP